MPAINKPVALSKESLSKIKIAKALLDFGNHTWSDPELESVRKEIRNHYRKEQKLVCAYCQAMLTIHSAEACPIEHIAPKSIYPQFMFEPRNLCVICADCNNYKSQRETIDSRPLDSRNKKKYPFEIEKFRCYHPHLDNYNEHIKKAGFLYIELSKRGGYTIYICNLNRYLQEFGVSDEFMDNLNIITQQEVFHQTSPAP